MKATIRKILTAGVVALAIIAAAAPPAQAFDTKNR
jgi:hypothetical protein